MEIHRRQISLASVFFVITALAVVLACSRTEFSRMFVLPMVVALLCGLLFPYGVRIGLTLGAVIVVVNAALAEKDPSGLGPNEVVIPFHLIVFALPICFSAWLGKAIRDLISN